MRFFSLITAFHGQRGVNNIARQSSLTPFPGASFVRKSPGSWGPGGFAVKATDHRWKHEQRMSLMGGIH